MHRTTQQGIGAGSTSNRPAPTSSSSSSTTNTTQTQTQSQSNNDKRPSDKSSDSCIHNRAISKTNALTAGIVSGVGVAGLFNPWDRALYLSVVHERPFFALENWRKPYTGFCQVLVHRTLTSGIYFPLFDLLNQPCENVINNYTPLTTDYSPRLHNLAVSFLVGNCAGALSGVLLNPLTAIKYSAWDTQKSFFTTAKELYRSGGFRPFTNAIGPTILRDTIFGGCFSVTKHIVSTYWIQKDDSERLKKSKDFVASALGGASGTIISAPFNFIRNIQFGTPPNEKPHTATGILYDLYNDCKHSKRPFSYLQDRLRIGWGTARVAVGMAVGYELYDLTKQVLDNKASHVTELLIQNTQKIQNVVATNNQNDDNKQTT